MIIVYSLDNAVEDFMAKGETKIPPHLVNPFLRVMEIMEKPCSASLNTVSPSNQKAFYAISEKKQLSERNCETCGNRQPLPIITANSPQTRCNKLCDISNGFVYWEPSCGAQSK
jgi:hypothetical protein